MNSPRARGRRTLSLTIDRLDGDGAGVAPLRGAEIRVWGVLPGEVVEAEVDTHGRAMLVGVVRPSPHRVTPPCPHAGPCGGCTWQHIAYAEQLRLKHEYLTRVVREALGPRAPAVDPPIGLVDPWGYRHKAHLVFTTGPTGTLALGHYRRGSQRVLPVETCPVHAPRAQAVATALLDRLSRLGLDAAGPSLRGVLRHLVVRAAAHTGETLATLVVSRPEKALKPIAAVPPDLPFSLHLNVHPRPSAFLFGPGTRRLAGQQRLREEVAGLSFLVSPTAFFQTNVEAAETLVGLVLEAVPADRAVRVLDLYAGAGLFALPLARRGHHVMAVEESAAAVDDGERSRALNRIPDAHCTFRCGRVEDLVPRQRRPAGSFALVLDPPRGGCAPRVLDEVFGRLVPDVAAYVSCDPDALARDLRRIAGHGYCVTRLQPVDMFPHTAHIEAVATIARPR